MIIPISEDSNVALLNVGDHGVAHMMMKEPVACGCGTMHYALINRDGKTRCVECDFDYQNSGEALKHPKRKK